MYRALLVALALCCLPVAVFAQCTLELEIIVVEKHNGRPLYPVVAHIDELNATFHTDEKGRFVVENLCPGKYTFHFHAEGYEHYAEQVNVLESGSFKFRLAHLQGTLVEVMVKAEKTPTLLQDKDKLDKKELAQGSGRSLADILQSVNGVTMIANGATIAKPVIHGLHSNRIVLMNNGVRQEDQQWGSEHAPNIDPFLAENITVVKGAASVRYGTDAIAGVVLVEPKPLRRTPGWEGELNMAAFSNNRMGAVSGMAGHNFKKLDALSFRVQGTYKKGGNYRVPGYWVANTGVEENNYSATVGWNKLHYGAEVFYSHFDTRLGVYRGAHTGSREDLYAAIASDTPRVPAGFTYSISRPRQHVLHDLLKTRIYLDSRWGMWHLTHAYQHNYRREYDVLRIENNKAQMNLTLNTRTLNLGLEHHRLWKLDGEVGADAIFQENFVQPGDRLFIPNYRSRGAAGYVIERYKGSNWLLEAGIRYDYRWYELFNPEGSSGQVKRYVMDYNSVSGTIGFRKTFSDSWNYAVTLSNAWRAPQANELFSAGLHHSAARIELGNRDLVPERSYNLNLETQKQFGKKLSADVSLYTQYINNFIYLEPGTDILTIRGYFKTFSYKQTNAHLSGADLSALYKWNTHLESSVKAAFLFARNTIQNDWLILMPADRLTLNTRYIADVNEKIRETFVSADVRYVFNQWRIPRNFDDIDYPRPPAGYLLLDASAGAKLMMGEQPLYISLTIMNMLNRKYRDYLDAFRYFIDQPGTNVVLRLRIPVNISQ